MEATAGTIEDFYANADLQRTLIATGGYSGGSIQYNPTYPDTPTYSASSTLQSTIPAGIPGALAQIGVKELQQFACNLFPSLCGNQSLMAQTTAPKAGLLTGACPPGRVIRHISMGRDICIKKPRMNPLNPKALNRAVRRLSGFQHFAVKTEKAIQASFRKAGVAPHRRASAGRCTTCRKTACSCRG